MMKSNIVKTTIIILTAMLVVLPAADVLAKRKAKVFSGTPVEPGSPTAAKLTGLPPIVGPKKLIAVGSFENKTSFSGQWNLGDGMAEMLTTALIQSARFIVLERPEVEKILKEQNFAASDRTTGTGGAKLGKVLRAQILVMGAITEFSQNTQDSGVGFATDKVGLGVKVNKAHVAINLRMVDTTSGQVLYSERVKSEVKRSGVSVDYSSSDFAIGGSHFKKTPLGEATQKAIDQAVMYIAKKMQGLPWKGRIVLVKEDSKIYINAGRQGAIKPGMTFTVYRPGEELIDPETGLNLGSEETLLGRISVVEVKDKFSIAIAEEGEGFDRNDIIRYEIPKSRPGAVITPEPKVIEGVPVE